MLDTSIYLKNNNTTPDYLFSVIYENKNNKNNIDFLLNNL